MDQPIRCKRIIDGKTYNTETSTQLGEEEGPYRSYALFKTRHGAYFLYFDNKDEPELDPIIPIEPNEAQRWMERCCSTDRVEAEFGEMPDAGDEEARITLRIPDSLRKRIAVIAESHNQSLNAWILRCVERCASMQEKETD